MTKIDVVSGFLGAGKTTLIKKLLQEALSGSKTVLIENEFGEIGIDGGFLKESGIEIKEMNSGCICCSLVGDFGASLKEVIETYEPERILIEPSGVGKLSDVLKAVDNVALDLDVQVNSAVAVVDAAKCKMYIKNFGEFFINQIEYAGTVILSRTDKVSEEKIHACVELIRQYNKKAAIITTPLKQLDGKDVLETIEGADRLEDMMQELLKEACGHEHHHHEEDCGHEHHHHHEEACDHEHHHHHEGDCGHEHHHHHEEGCDHEHHHHHDEDCDCGCHDHHHEHGHHHADEVFTSWGVETPNVYSAEEIEQILTALDSGEYGAVLRAKGMLPAADGSWIYYDYVPGEHDVRSGRPMVTGKICVIGSKLDEEKLGELFRQ
ncbi:CobW family GTP-binding protein [Candidatus Acetatifactor stercoripullorum]|uniref:CobW family GTP-binding protein n=1 Tax=Candidatus Acetatifactor stercoripullorum TaxID=2838414 RepID=UPI00298DAEE6|nr:GTP-binding protein [Candidatus Acetatifactor stercoripullorum]